MALSLLAIHVVVISAIFSSEKLLFLENSPHVYARVRSSAKQLEGCLCSSLLFSSMFLIVHVSLQIVVEEFLEDINNILNSGEV